MINKPKIDLKLLILIGIGVSFLCIVFIFCLAIFNRDQLPYEKVNFSNVKHEKERQKAIELLQKEYSPEVFSSKNIPYDKRDRMVVYPDELNIACVDLNNDKILDVIAFTRAGGFNGTVGGCTVFWTIDKQGHWHKVIDLITQNLIIIFKQTHYGFRDIAFMTFGNIGDTKEGRSIWQWNGKEYDYVGLKPLIKLDWEVFKDD